MVRDGDKNLTCRQCGKEFIFTKAEQEFYMAKGFTLPHRCKECCSTKKDAPYHLVCSQCGTDLEKGTSIYCTACLANVQIEFELKTDKTKKATNEAYAKLRTIESEKTELAELLHQKEQMIEKLELQFDNISRDLEKAVQFHAALGWLEPKLNGIEEKLKSLEYAHNKTNERMLQVVQRMHELYETTTLLEIVKRSLKRYQKQSTQLT